MSGLSVSLYYDKQRVDSRVAAGNHRSVIGGMWEELGRLQRDVLVARGLLPTHRFLDLGCGSLRGGVQIIPYLDAGNYYGFDINQSLLDAGYEREILPAGLADRLPRSQLVASDDFSPSLFATQFDRVLAWSVFTHLTFNLVRIYLERLVPSLAVGGEFYATYFEVPADKPTFEPLFHQPGGRTTYGQKDPYHYRFEDLAYAATGLPWHVERVSEFNHPRDQRMALFRRVEDGLAARS